jgi:hypothetical protein
MARDNRAEGAALVWLCLGIAALAGAVYVSEWIAYAALGLTFAGLLVFFLWPSRKTRQR